MKKLRLCLILLVSLLLLLAFTSCEGKTVTRVYVNDEMHAIAEYSDGTTEDLGYVGVVVEKEVLPPKYTVTFLDAFGATLKTEKVYKGDSATAPEAPEIADKAFDKWDTDFSAVSGDITVRPVYVAAQEYTVTFLDENGNTLATEKVIHGHAAEAPTAPLREDTIFKEWDTAFDAVKSDLTVRAVYRAKETYTVTFKDYSGVLLGTATVKETGTAQAPVTPVREGYKFAGWSSTLDNVTSNKTVTAKYTLNAGSNILDLSYTVAQDGTVTLTATVKGSVNFAAFQGKFAISSGVKNVTVVEGGGTATTNYTNDGEIKFVRTNATNITKETVLFVVTFETESDTVTLTPTIDFCKYVSSTEPQPQQSDVPYSIIGETLKLK